MPRSAYDTTGTPKPKNGLPKETPHNFPPRKAEVYPAPFISAKAKLHREEAFYCPKEQEVNPQHDQQKEEGYDALIHER